MNKTLAKILLLFVFPAILVAQQSNIRIYSTKNGLSNQSVTNLIQSKDGFLWVATEGGLSRFDGKTFINYNTKNGLPGNNITAVCEDKNSNIWFSIFGISLVKFDGSKFTFFDKKDGLENLDIYTLYCDSKGNIWIPTNGGGIYCYDGKKFISYNETTGLHTNRFFSVTEDAAGNIWIGSKGKGVVKYNGNTFEWFNNPEIEKNNSSIFSLLFDSKGTLWIGTTSHGIYTFAGGELKLFYINDEVATDFIGEILEDKRNNIWFATSYGAIKYKNNDFNFYTEDKGLSSNVVQSLCVDYEGNVWFGTVGSGLCLLRNEAMVTYTDNDGLSSNKISLVKQFNNGNYLIGTDGMGVNKFDGEKIEHLIEDKILSDGVVTALHIDKKENIWIGKETFGLAVLKHINSPSIIDKGYPELIEKISVRSITDINGDEQDNIWITTFGGGAFKFNNGNIEEYTIKTGLPTDNILTVFVDSKNNVWLGTFQAGIINYDGKKIKVYDKKDGLQDNTIWSICEDNKGNLFFGTAEAGIAVYNGSKFKNISIKDGLCSDLIYALTVDSKNNLWVGTDKGLNRLELDENLNIKSIRYYGELDGLRSAVISQNGLMLDKEGVLWISTANGLTKYNSNNDFVKTIAPKLALTGIKLYYKEVDWTALADTVDVKTHLPGNLDLSYKNNHLTFNYQALTTNDVYYTYILENFENEWSPKTTVNEAVYSNIPPGNYTFKVKAVNNDGYWSDIVSYSFSISPPFWKTWWFYTLLGITILISIISFINWRTARLEKEKRILENKVDERTKELQVAHNKLSFAYQDIKDSIQYAKQIQDAILPLPDDLKKVLPDSFIFFKPRDVVSGDFYWFNIKKEGTFFAAVDCTGHGVPGAFMSMIGNTLLNEIINKQNITEPASILTLLNDEVRKALKQDREMVDSKDGMDLALCSLKNNILQYSGARRPLYIIRNNGSFEEIKGDKMSIGGMQLEEKTIFTNHNIKLEKGDAIYIFSDGYVDQFGGERGKKFTSKRLQELLMNVSKLPMSEQFKKITDNLTAWTGNVEQIDDILVIGIRV